jgi:hypothetical protein
MSSRNGSPLGCFLQGIDRLLTPLRSFRERRVFRQLLPVDAFEDAIAREKSRGQRYGGVLSVVLFDDERCGDGNRWSYRLVKALLDRVRFTDVVGRCGDGRIGVLLPDTDEQGASVFAERFRRRLTSARIVLRYETVTHHPFGEPSEGASRFARISVSEGTGI